MDEYPFHFDPDCTSCCIHMLITSAISLEEFNAELHLLELE